jgi:glycosyltransferase 2 family protein
MSARWSAKSRWGHQLSNFLRASRVIYTPVAFIFIVVLLISERAALYERFSALQFWAVVAVIGSLYVGHLCIGLSSWLVFRAYGCDLSYATVLRTHIARLPARYIPGGIWQTVSRSLDFVNLGVPGRSVLMVMLTEMGISVATAATLGGACTYFSGAGHANIGLLASTAGCVGLAALPIAAVLERGGRSAPAWLAYAAAVMTYVMVWTLYATAFWFFLHEVAGRFDWLTSTGVFLLSWVVGFFAFFAPQGVGVFEMTAGIMLTGAGSAVLMAMLLGFRLIGFTADISLYGVYRVLIARKRLSSQVYL